MRSILLAGCLLCLAVLASPAVAEGDFEPAAPAPTAEAQAAGDAAPAPAAAPPVAEEAPVSTPAALCPAPQALGSGFGTWCGDPCSAPEAWDYCVGYDCGGILRLDECRCYNGSWRCAWQENCPGW